MSSNFVIGWTGRKFNALQVFKALIPRFKNKIVSKEEVEEFLTSFPAASFIGEADENKLIMSGWVVDGKGKHPFVWNSEYNQQGIDVLVSDPNESYFNGSGAAYFQRLITNPDVIGNTDARDKTEFTKIAILTELGYLVANEFLDTELWANDRFGFGYEALIQMERSLNTFLISVFSQLTLRAVKWVNH